MKLFDYIRRNLNTAYTQQIAIVIYLGIFVIINSVRCKCTIIENY